MIRINLAPPETRSRRAGGPSFQLRLPEFNLGIAFAAVYLVALIFVGGWWWQATSHEADLTARVKQKTGELTTLKARVAEAGKIKQQLAELQKRVDTIQELTKGQARVMMLFDALADVVPRDLWLTALEERGTTVRLTGTAFSATAVSDLMSNLRASTRFKDVDIIISRQDLTKNPRLLTFEVTCRFES